MNIAIIGAGFSGLALAYFLLQSSAHVTLFDAVGIGGGASGIATGLLHPYPGEQGRRSWMADEAIAATKDVLKQVEEGTGRTIASYDGIVRIIKNEEQREVFLSHIERHGDVEQIDDRSFLIRSGVTVHCPSYLQGLWELIEQRGGKLIRRRVSSLSELEDFDQVVIAAGNGIFQFDETKNLRVRSTKGQVLTAQLPPHLHGIQKSLIGKGYLAKGERPDICYVGSTYEKGVVSEEPDLAFAQKEILPKIAFIFPEVDQLKILGCKAGFRVSRNGNPYPIAGRLSEKAWVFTALGSRGLLYHAYLAQLLSNALLKNSAIPQEAAPIFLSK